MSVIKDSNRSIYGVKVATWEKLPDRTESVSSSSLAETISSRLLQKSPLNTEVELTRCGISIKTLDMYLMLQNLYNLIVIL
jgi:hypothetical protein